MTPGNTNTQNLTYVVYKIPNLLILIPTALQKLHSAANKCYPRKTFPKKIFYGNMWDQLKYSKTCLIWTLLGPKKNVQCNGVFIKEGDKQILNKRAV